MAKQRKAETKLDSWSNIASAMGIPGRDRTTAVRFTGAGRLSQTTLEALYSDDGIAFRAVERVVLAMTREGFTVTGDDDDLVTSRLEEIGAQEVLRDCLRWSMVHGGALGVLGINTARDRFDEPVDEESIDSLDFVRAYDRFRVLVRPNDYYADPASPKFDTPQFYMVTPLTKPQYRVHESRCVRFDGLPVTPRTRIANQGWGDSVYQKAWTQLKNLGAATGGVANIIEDFIQAVVTIKGLSAKIAAGQESQVATRLQMMDYSRSILNMIAMDADGETYTKHASSVSGLPELVTGFWESLANVLDMPLTVLLGHSPAGLNATGESDMSLWYDRVKGDQNDKLAPALERIVEVILKSKQGPFDGKEPEGWSIAFTPLWQMSAADEATIYKTTSDADVANVNAGILDADEVARARYGVEGGFGGIEIDPETRITPPEPTPEPPISEPVIVPTNGTGAIQ